MCDYDDSDIKDIEAEMLDMFAETMDLMRQQQEELLLKLHTRLGRYIFPIRDNDQPPA